MNGRRVELLLLVILAAITFIVAALGVRDARSDRLVPSLRSLWPGGFTPPNPVLGASCTRDPANLPPAPNGPDGRPSNYLHTCGARIYDSRGQAIKITGVNWSGMENSDAAPGGLGNRNWQEILDQVAGLGYNTIRVPFSSEAIESGQPIGGVNFALNPDLQGLNGLGMLDQIVAGARARGLKVILDRHQPTAAGRTPLWYTSEVPEDRWIADWRTLAARYRGNDTVIGVDLSNEPHGPATWGTDDPATDWRLAAERAGNAVLGVNPYLLVFVEGIEIYQGDHFWWGGNLEGVRAAPVKLRVPSRVVYSPHDYGPYVSDQPWFHAPDFPRNLPAEWDRHWGYISEDGIAPVVVGEFGGWSFGNDADGEWQQTLLQYLRAHDVSFLVWSLNPTWDTGGILNGDWQTVNAQKQAEYRPLLAPPLDTGPTGTFGLVPTRVKLLVDTQPNGAPSGAVALAFRILNDGPASLDLSRLEVRYWFRDGPRGVSAQAISANADGLPGGSIQADVVPTGLGGQDHYLRVRFAPGSGSIERYRESGTVTVSFQKPVRASYPPANDYSFVEAPATPGGEGFEESNRVTVYLDGRLAWGREP